MLTTEAAVPVIKIAKGLIKPTSRIDIKLAEKEAVQGPLALPVTEVCLPPMQPRMLRALRELHNDTAGHDPDIASRHEQALELGLKELPNPSIRIYLATLQAQIALRLANHADVSDAQKLSVVTASMVMDLERYVQYFSIQDQQWVIDNPNTNLMEAETLMADFRNRVWLREMIRNYKITAQELELPPALAWKPGWITVLELN